MMKAHVLAGRRVHGLFVDIEKNILFNTFNIEKNILFYGFGVEKNIFFDKMISIDGRWR